MNTAMPSVGLPREVAAAGEDLPLVIAAWCRMDADCAAELYEAWLNTASGNGMPSPPCPVLCQWAERVAEALGEKGDAFVDSILPRLANALNATFDRYDPEGRGLPCWPDAAEALFPATAAPGEVRADLLTLLSNEARAFGRLAKGHTVSDFALDTAEGERNELDDWLLNTFWDGEEGVAGVCALGGEMRPDVSPSGLFPLVWEGRTAAMVDALRPRAAANTADATWTARGWILFFALLLSTPHRGVLAHMRGNGLPAGASPTAEAAWRALSADVADASDATRAGKCHRRGWGIVVAIAVGVLVAGTVAGIALWRAYGPAAGAADVERRARVRCSEGAHAAAATLYAEAAERSSPAYFRYREAGEWMHADEPARAEALYRTLQNEEPNAPNVRLNLALAIANQGRLAEAAALYRAFAEDSATAEAHPDLAARARLAAELLERRAALDAH